MEPRIQYAKTSDGVNIAYWTLGAGVPLVITPVLGESHIGLEWESPELRAWYERLAGKRTVVRFDPRATGLSQRDVVDFSPAAQQRDLEAVLDRLESDQFALLAVGGGCFAAIPFATSHPERISHLVLWDCYERYSESFGARQRQLLDAMMVKDWDAYTETYARLALGWSEGKQAHLLSKFIKESVAPEAALAYMDANKDLDIGQFLPKIACPTLILSNGQYPTPDAARQFPSRVPGARLVLAPSMFADFGDWAKATAAIEEFLGEGEEEEPATPAASGGLVTILFTDMQSSTANRQQLGDTKAQEMVRTHNRIVREALAANGGNEIKHTGDGIMASFISAIGALSCAIAIQRGVEQHQVEAAGAPLRVYIGLNAGEPISEDDDLFGTSVDLAARICAEAEPSEILVSDVVRQLAAGKEFLFSDRGESALRGFEDPVRLWELRWREQD